MRNNKLLATLNDLGLSENEGKVYLAALSLGSTSILKISQAAGIKRTTVYSVIQSLKLQGLIRIDLKGTKELFAAENPEKLQSIFDARREKLKIALPEFSALFNLKGGESTIKYYEGLNSIKGIYENFLKNLKRDDFYLIISDMQQFLDLDKDYFENFIQQRSKLGLNIRSLFEDSESTRYYKRLEKETNQSIKILPKETKLLTNLVITPYQIVITQMTPSVTALVVEAPSIIQMHKQLFEIIWKSLEEK